MKNIIRESLQLGYDNQEKDMGKTNDVKLANTNQEVDFGEGNADEEEDDEGNLNIIRSKSTLIGSNPAETISNEEG